MPDLLTRVEMLKFIRAAVAFIFSFSDTLCAQIEDGGNLTDPLVAQKPTRKQIQTASNFVAVRCVANIFSRCEHAEERVDFQDWYDWIYQNGEDEISSPAAWLQWVFTAIDKSPDLER